MGFEEELKKSINKKISDIYFANSEELFKMAMKEDWKFDAFKTMILFKIMQYLEMIADDKRKFT